MKPTVVAWLNISRNFATTSMQAFSEWRSRDEEVLELISADEHSVTVSSLQAKLDYLQERHNALMLRYEAVCNERNELLKQMESDNDQEAS